MSEDIYSFDIHPAEGSSVRALREKWGKLVDGNRGFISFVCTDTFTIFLTDIQREHEWLRRKQRLRDEDILIEGYINYTFGELIAFIKSPEGVYMRKSRKEPGWWPDITRAAERALQEFFKTSSHT